MLLSVKKLKNMDCLKLIIQLSFDLYASIRRMNVFFLKY